MNDTTRESLIPFSDFRLKLVTVSEGILIWNDTQSTTPNSSWYALEYIRAPIVWIAGGLDRGGDWDFLQSLVKEKVSAIITIGQDNRSIHSAFERSVGLIISTDNMDDCVRQALNYSKRGTSILFSPGCASFDLFNDKDHRGEMFFKTVVEMV